MSITHTDAVECVCKTPVTMSVADSLNAGRHPHLKQAPPEGVEPRVATVSRAIYDEVEAKFDEILVRHPGLAKSAHVSLLRLIEWPT